MTQTFTTERPTGLAPLRSLPAATPSSVLPPPVARFVDLAMHANTEPIETVELTCDAWMHRPWWLPIPLQIRMSHRLGTAFVHEIRLGRGRLSVPIGLDAFIDERGAMVVGRSAQTGRTFDQGACVAMWGEALVFPGSWLGRADVAWESFDTQSARFIVPGPDGDIPILVSFDQRTGLPTTCAASRYKGRGPMTRWYGTWSEWVVGPEGVLAPRRMRVRWGDESRPWLSIRVTRLSVNTPVDETFDRARAALGRRAVQPPNR